MSPIEIVLLAFGLAADAFAVCLGACAGERPPEQRGLGRMAFHFGLLAFVGGRMVRSGLDKDCETYTGDPSRGATLIMLAVATSIDALAVGLSLGLVGISIWYPAVMIGLITAAISFVGGWLGRRLGMRYGKRMSIAGGGILLFIGLRILISHITG